jgi:hypothetical protein
MSLVADAGPILSFARAQRLERVMYAGVSTDSARSSSGHSRARGNPGGPPDLDPGVRRDDVSSLYLCTWESVQHA